MTRSYLTHSPVAWGALVAIVLGFALKFVVMATGLPVWLVPVGYFVALAGAAVLFVGWVRWKAAHPDVPRN
ncbi:hypothetical protein MWU52_05835 [Jannaschia sp. S6380]|uniref:hypothetical protein n=1 Tax=Jannaschia sp. S6380 TaxID=2926408 RepID=UPI001FF5D409|nr:hypothetical protein [Jannaschia sp. S6380]MCK0167064.1 hypothetical protein [Jannaschia sp. S6380]